MLINTKKISESLGSNIAKYQRWVDYDMKRFGKISEKTQAEVDAAGLQIIKDQHGDYEVTAGDYEAKEDCGSKEKKTVFESLDDTDVETLSTFDLTETETSEILSLFELISDENKDKAFAIIKALFEGKKLVPSEEKEEAEESIQTPKTKCVVSESYTRMLLGDK